MFDGLNEKFKEKESRTKYTKFLGWIKENETETETESVIADFVTVFDMYVGYGVVRIINDPELLFHSMELSEAVEWAVDYARKEIASNEMMEVNRQPTQRSD